MRIGIVVDGEAEYASLTLMFPALQAHTNHTLLHPVLAKIQPYAPPGAIAQRCTLASRAFLHKSPDLIVVLFDRENRSECCGTLARQVEASLESGIPCSVGVVVKDRMFENWLVADLDALEQQPARFRLSQRDRRLVAPNKSDRCDALSLLKRATGHEYDKVRDAKNVLKRASPERIAANSRSFRGFLRLLGDPDYLDQSLNPR